MPRERVNAENFAMARRFLDTRELPDEPLEEGQAQEEVTETEPDTRTEPEVEVSEAQEDLDGQVPEEGQTDEETPVLGFSTLDELAEAAEVPVTAITEGLRVPINVNGEVGEVSLSEALAGYQKQQDYIRKSEAVANERKAIEAERAEIERVRGEKLQALDQVLSEMDAQLGNDAVELNALLQAGDTDGYLHKQHQMQQRAVVREKAVRERSEEYRRFQEEQISKHTKYVEGQQAALKKDWPEFFDPKTAPVVHAEVRDFLKDYGATDQEIDGITSAAAFKVVKDAMAFKSQQKEKPAVLKKVKSTPKMAKPGVSRPKTDKVDEKRQQLRERLKRTGKVRDAAALLGTYRA